MENENLKTVALVGRPNVGKSTLFNRLIGQRKAIETPIPGTTRDRLYGEVSWCGKEFNIIDLAGIEFGTKEEIDRNIQESVNFAIETADLILFIVDWEEKENPIDKRIARLLQKASKNVLMVINKADNLERINSIEEFKRLGKFEMVPVSAIGGKNTGDLLDVVCSKISESKPVEKKVEEPKIKLAIIGRPNTGKSTLINTIIGDKRAVVSAEAGTTRDVVNVDFIYKGTKIEIADTAGIRRPGKIQKDTIESFGLLRTHRALKESDIAILLIDGIEGLVSSDANILGQAKEWGKGIILAVNKIDMWDDLETKMPRMIAYLQEKLNFTPWLPIIFISAKEKENIKPLLNQIMTVYKNRNTTIDQKELDQILEDAKQNNFQLSNLTSISQKKTNPPIFEVKFKKEEPHVSQIRYLENRIRDNYPMTGTPIFIDLSRRGKSDFNKKSPK